MIPLAAGDVLQNVAVAQTRSKGKVTSPESIKLLAYGKAGRRKAPQTERLLEAAGHRVEIAHPVQPRCAQHEFRAVLRRHRPTSNRAIG